MTGQLKFVFCILALLLIKSVCGQDTANFHLYGGAGEDKFGGITSTFDSGFAVIGSTGTFGNGNSDLYLLKLDSNLAVSWTKTIGGNGIETGTSIVQLPDSGFLIAGSVNNLFDAQSYDGYLVRTDAQGSVLWDSKIGGTELDFFYSATFTTDSAFVAVGETKSFGNGASDVYVVKVDSVGDVVWTKTFGETGEDIARKIIPTIDSQLLIVGQKSSTVSTDSYVLKLNNDGDTTWTGVYGGALFDAANGVVETSDSGFAVIGSTASFGPGPKDLDVYIYKLDKNGVQEWDTIHGNIINNSNDSTDDVGNDIIQLSDDRFVFIGSTKSFGFGGTTFDLYAVRTDTVGLWLSGPTFGGTENDEGQSVLLLPDGSFVFAGTTKSFGSGFNDILVVKRPNVFTPTTTIHTIHTDSLPFTTSLPAGTTSPNTYQLKVYPNPASDIVTFSLIGGEVSGNHELTVHNSLGQQIASTSINNKKFVLDTTSWGAKGLYHYRITQNGKVAITGKLIVQ